jgi:hypothetical protein
MDLTLIDPYVDFEFDEAGAVVYPFDEETLNADVYTGADWYRMALSASLGGACVNGINAAPSCEVLAKVDMDFAKKHAVGWLSFEDTDENDPEITNDLGGSTKKGRPFRGIATSSGAELLMSDVSWESSNATRAKNAAILASSMTAYGMDPEDVKDIIEAATGSELEEEVVTAVSLPISMLKREAASYGKRNHSVYSRGAYQRKVKWKDTSLLADELPTSAALDWGRVTATARYIAEANLQLCGKFRDAVKNVDIPYAIIQGSWASVSPTDMVFEVGDLTGVKELAKACTMVPPLTGYYSDVRDNIAAVLSRALTGATAEKDTNLHSALASALDAVRVRKVKVVKIKTTGSDLYAPLTTHAIDASAAAGKVRESGTTFHHIASAVGKLVKVRGNEETRMVFEELVARRTSFDETKMVDLGIRAMRFVVSEPPWTLAAATLGDAISNHRTAETRLMKLYRSITSSSAVWVRPPVINERVFRKGRLQVLGIVKESMLGQLPHIPDKPLITGALSSSGLQAQMEILKNAKKYLKDVSTKWADRYQAWANILGGRKAFSDQAMSVKYGTTSSAFRSITANELCNAASGYIQVAKPMDSYLYKAAKAYARKRGKTSKLAKITMVSNAKQLASMLDDQLEPTVLFADVEMFVSERLGMIAKDLALGKVPVIADEEPEEEAEVKPPEPVNTADADAEKAAILAALAATLMGLDEPIVRVTYESVLNSYPSHLDPEKFAKVLGFDDSMAAYRSLGENFRYDTESPYTLRALTALAGEAKAEEEEEIDDDAFTMF